MFSLYSSLLYKLELLFGKLFFFFFSICWRKISSIPFRYIVSYIPGGARGLKFFSKLFYTFVSKTVTTTLSVWEEIFFCSFICCTNVCFSFLLLLLNINWFNMEIRNKNARKPKICISCFFFIIILFLLCFKDMFMQNCLQRTISKCQLIMSVRTFKRFGEYVKGYGHEPQYYQGGIWSFVLFLRDRKKHWLTFVSFYSKRLPAKSRSFERSTWLSSAIYWSKRMDFRSGNFRTEWLYW